MTNIELTQREMQLIAKLVKAHTAVIWRVCKETETPDYRKDEMARIKREHRTGTDLIEKLNAFGF